MLNESRAPASYLKKLGLGITGNWTKADCSFTGQFYFSPDDGGGGALKLRVLALQGSTRRRHDSGAQRGKSHVQGCTARATA